MAFLFIVQVPFETIEKNKLDEEIKEVAKLKLKEKDSEQNDEDSEDTEESDTESEDKDSRAEDSDIASSIDEKEIDTSDLNKESKADDKPIEASTDVDTKGNVRKESTDLSETDTTESTNREDSVDIVSSADDTTPSETQDIKSNDVRVNYVVKEADLESEKDVSDKVDTNENEPKEELDDQECDKEEKKDKESEETEKKDGENGEELVNDDDENKDVLDDLTPLLPNLPLHKLVEEALFSLEVNNFDTKKVGDGTYIKFSFVQQDSQRCEVILNKLKALGVGSKDGSFVSVFPASLHESPEDSAQSLPENGEPVSEEFKQKESQFKKSIKSRLVVAQVVASVRSNAQFTFDYLLLLILASVISCLGLVENSSVILVASMLISPLMGPILAGTFGQVIKMAELRNLGVKSELIGLLICLIVGFVFGLISGGIGLNGAVWGSTDSWPTAEMKSRGLLRSLWVGILIALPSGAGVAISVLGGNAGSLVGVAISASLLPPACNAGVLWAYALLAAISPPEIVQNLAVISTTISPINSAYSTNITMNNASSGLSSSTSLPVTVTPYGTDTRVPESCAPLVNNAYRQVYSCNVAQDAALLGLISLLLTLLNITCILIMGIIVLKIKEVAPKTAGSTNSLDSFWQEDVQVARTYYQTTKGKHSASLGREFLNEWQKINKQEKKQHNKLDKISEETEDKEGEDTESLAGNMATINLVKYIKDVEHSQSLQHFISRLSPATPPELISAGLSSVYNRAALDLELKLSKHPAVYLAETKVKDKVVQNVYHTIHGSSGYNDEQQRTSIGELRNRFNRPTKSAYFDGATYDVMNEQSKSPKASDSAMGLVSPSSSGLWKRRKKVKFQKFEVVKVEEENLLPKDV